MFAAHDTQAHMFAHPHPRPPTFNTRTDLGETGHWANALTLMELDTCDEESGE